MIFSMSKVTTKERVELLLHKLFQNGIAFEVDSSNNKIIDVILSDHFFFEHFKDFNEFHPDVIAGCRDRKDCYRFRYIQKDEELEEG